MDRLDDDPNVELTADLARTEAELVRTRARLTASLGALREEISDLADWRSWVERHPWPFLGGALAVGLIVGWSVGRGD
jgi:ElaB/YqjD/DUF883 family membrane-anchored ribosome-binding protein